MLKTFTCMALSGLMTTGLLATEKTVKKEAPKAESFKEAFTKGTFKTDLVLSYEHSDLEGGASRADALSLRVRPSFRTAEFAGVSAFVQGHANLNLVDQFSHGRDSGDSSHDVIADAEGARIHQAYLDFSLIPDTVVRIGRQEIIMGDARFVGNVGWRQNGQSFDAIKVTNKSVDKLTLTAFITNAVQDIHLEENDLEYFAGFDATYAASKKLNISTFAYALEDNSGTRDNYTLGARANGKVGIVKYDVSAAAQEDLAKGTGHNGQMFRSFLGLDTKPVNFGIGYEQYSGGFDTLFGTAHKFLGWSDQFLNTKDFADGLEDIYFQVGSKVAKTTLLARYHIFNSAEGSNGDYGSEVELLAKRKFQVTEKHAVTGILKAAFYQADSSNNTGKATNDEAVYWARLMYSF